MAGRKNFRAVLKAGSPKHLRLEAGTPLYHGSREGEISGWVDKPTFLTRTPLQAINYAMSFEALESERIISIYRFVLKETVDIALIGSASALVRAASRLRPPSYNVGMFDQKYKDAYRRSWEENGLDDKFDAEFFEYQYNFLVTDLERIVGCCLAGYEDRGSEELLLMKPLSVGRFSRRATAQDIGSIVLRDT